MCSFFENSYSVSAFTVRRCQGDDVYESEGRVRGNWRGWMDESGPKGRGGAGKENYFSLEGPNEWCELPF